MNFGKAYSAMEMGAKVQLRGWRAPETRAFVALQRPDENSFMTTPYMYLEVTYESVTNRAPWTPQPADLVSDDWDYAE